MSYFKYTGKFSDFKHEHDWEKVVKQIRSLAYPKLGNSLIEKVSLPIEAKALHIFTFASRFLNSVDSLVSQNNGNWHLMFVVTSVILYPLIEMIGDALLGKDVQSSPTARLLRGIYWLENPNLLDNSVILTRASAENDLTTVELKYTKAQVKTLYLLRHFYLHGIRSSHAAEENLIDYKLPRGMAWAIENGLYIYWDNLTNDDGKQGWLERLAVADIYPFKISGSNGAEDGLIDPNIIGRILQRKLRDNPQ